MVPADSCRISRVPHYSGAGSAVFGISRTGLSPSAASLSRLFRYPSVVPLSPVLQPRRCRNTDGLGSCAFARHYWRNHCCFLFLRVLRCFSSPGWPLPLAGGALCSASGCPIRTSAVMAGICPLPRLFAACHVLLRLREPRHPSCALLSFSCAFGKSPFVSRVPQGRFYKRLAAVSSVDILRLPYNAFAVSFYCFCIFGGELVFF